MNIHHDSRREHNRLLVAGVAFLTLIGLLIGLSIAIYQKVFDDVTTITIKADHARVAARDSSATSASTAR